MYRFHLFFIHVRLVVFLIHFFIDQMIGADVHWSLALGELQQKWWLDGNIGQSKVGILRTVRR